MKKFRKFISKYGFSLFVVLYITQRDYPFGGTMQTITDVLILITLILSGVNIYMEWLNKKLDKKLEKK